MKNAVLVTKDFFSSSLKDSGLYVSSVSRYITAYLVLSDNSKIIIANDQGHLTIWCPITFTFIKSLEISESSINTITEILGSNRIVTSTFYSDLTLLDLISFEKISQFSFRIPIMCLKGLNHKLFIISSLGKLSVLETEPFRLLNEFNTKNFTVSEFDLCDVNKVMVLACRNKFSLVYSLNTFEKIATNFHISSVNSICISSTFSVYACGEYNGVISVFNLSNKSLLWSFNTKFSTTRTKFLDNDSQILSISNNNELTTFTTKGLEVISQSKISGSTIRDLKIFENGSKIVCLCQDGSINIVDLSNKKSLGHITQLITSIKCIYSITNTPQFLTYDKSGTINLWNTSEKKSPIQLSSIINLEITSLSLKQRFLIISDKNLKVFIIRIPSY